MPRRRPQPDDDTPAARYARALLTTTDRYLTGCMSHASWVDHMTSLWGRVRWLESLSRDKPYAWARGLTRDVLTRVGGHQSTAAKRFTTKGEE